MSAAYTRLLDALQQHGYAVVKGGRCAFCPSHRDHWPSLRIEEAVDFPGVIVTCEAGCQLKDVLAALDLTITDLCDDYWEREQGYYLEAEYVYTDEAGYVLYVVERRFPKDFAVKRPKSARLTIYETMDADFTYGLGRARQVLYRLPDVLAAVSNGQTVYVAEGEEDVEALARLGFTATCNPLGAGHWRPEYGHALMGGDVIVIADRDTLGRTHAAAVAAALAGKAASVAVVEPARGNDVSEHLAYGFSIADLI